MSVGHIVATDGLQDRQWNEVQFRLIFAIAFMFHFAAAIGARFTPRHWRQASMRRSIFAEACKGAGTTAQIAFAG